MDMNELTDTVKGIVGPAVKEAVDASVKEQIDAQMKEAMKAMRPTPEDEAVNKAKADNPFKGFGDFLTAVYKMRHAGTPDNRLSYLDTNNKIVKPAVDVHGKTTLAEGTDSAGGFLVPAQYQAQLLQIGLEKSIVRQNGAFTVPMASDMIQFPRVNDTTHASNVYGGVLAYWQAEEATMNESEPVFGNITLTAKNLQGYTKASNQLIADSAISLEPWLMRSFGEAWAYFEDIAFLRGTGSGQPLGILNAGALISVTRQDTDEILFQDINNIWSRVLPESRDRGVWVANHEVLPQLLRLNAANTTTNAYGAQTVWINGITAKPIEQIFGRPVIFTEKMTALGTAGDLGFFDFGYYMIGDRQALTIDASTHVYFTTNHTAWRFTLRVDGQPILASALTPYQGTATLSPFVTLGSTS